MKTMSNKKLWKVKVEYHLVVLAEDKKEAKKQTLQEWAALELLQNTAKNMSVVCEVKTAGSVPPGWMDRIPYGRNLSRLLENITVREFIQRKLFNPFRREKSPNKEKIINIFNL
jgi:hypothetical protein